ncbi:3-oxoacyl-[acyl-carrier protein] reductase [Candidatus Burkholderia pumila]|uniref:3-oxoacyl-[acyl-carrier protein] reductase n=1 Tax=Candidatus Burkholderia pumila TaxID=1090375 RepID=A0ABR5HK86_9BURK|nr:3-oxoacyl-[acyl-carrier protein] reductase [Candidatus Burkholderia pumila]
MTRDEASDALTIACMPVLATTLLPPVLANFTARHPGVPIKVDSVKVPEVLVSLQNHQADVVLSQAFPAVAGIEVETLLKARDRCAMPATHRLAKKKLVVPENLRGEKLIGWLPNSRQPYEAEQSLISATEERPRYTVLTDTAHTRYAMVAGGLGVSIVEPFAAKVWREHGIGAAAARAFGRYGANVAVHYNRSKDQADEVARDVRALGVTVITVGADVRDSKAIDAAVAQTVEAFGKIDVLINNAGSLVKREPIASVIDELFDEVMHINTRSVVAFTLAALPSLKDGGGSIINVTSVAACNGGGPGALLYAASKGFVSTITKGMAKELMVDSIRVNAVAPGVVIQTPFQERFTTPEQLEAFRTNHSDELHRQAGRLQRCVPLPRVRCHVALFHGPDHRRERRAVDALKSRQKWRSWYKR